MADKTATIVETDEAGNITWTYVSSPTDTKGVCRIDIVHPTVIPPWQRLLEIFLPSGYPHSVTDDYLEYQIYDSLQAFSSSIAGLLSSRAVLSSVGVGDLDASPTSALLLSIFQESVGRLATITFAARLGTALEPECKMYRLLADILNDFAFILDCLSPGFPKAIRVIILSFSSVLRALCGVAAGSAKASLSAHFARWGNLGELNAKDSSQETVISLIGMLAGSLVVSLVTTPAATWTTLMLLLAIHLETNRRAVSAVSLRTLNRQRATLVYHHLKRGNVPKPEEVSKQERIFERDGVLRSAKDGITGYCLLGTSFLAPLRSMAFHKGSKRSMQTNSKWLNAALLSLKENKYALMLYEGSRPAQVSVVVAKGSSTRDLIAAWWQALAFADQGQHAPLETVSKDAERKITELLERTAAEASGLMSAYETDLREAGWDMETNALETKPSPRVSIG